MARFRTHAIVGLTVGAGAYVIRFSAERRRNPKAKIDMEKLLLCAGIGFLASCLPDIIEPPNDPNHRKFFHSVAFAGLGCLFLHEVLNGSLDEEFKTMLEDSWLGILSHLTTDFITSTRGLPLIG